MKRDPIDPVTFHRAAKELFQRLTAREGIDVAEFHRGEDDEASPEVRAQRHQTDMRLGELRSEAEFKLQGLMVVEDLRSWTSAGGEWRRVSQEQLKAWLMEPSDEPSRFYLDREELAYISLDSYAIARPPGEISSELSKVGAGKRGRPVGSGTYAESDAPLLTEMRGLRKSGKARSVHEASMMVADRAQGGGTTESKARRLRDAYLRKWRDGE